jgi:sporulation protein YqfC
MKIISKIRNYILEEEFTINIYKNKVNIVNYISIGHFDSNKVSIIYSEGEVLISGSNLVVSKLLHDEVLITGVIKNIELR